MISRLALRRDGGARSLMLNFLSRILFRRSRRIHEYFMNAVRVYILKGEEDAREAALAAARKATPRHRNCMAEELSKMASHVLHSYPEGDRRKGLAGRVFLMIEAVRTNGSIAIEGERGKENHSELNHEYLSCLNELDPSVFYRKHPELF